MLRPFGVKTGGGLRIARAQFAYSGQGVPSGARPGYMDRRQGLHPDAEKAYRYIDSELEHGQPVAVGVLAYSAKLPNAPWDKSFDKLTDHYVLVTGRTRNGYTFRDPATKDPARNHGTFVWEKGILVRSGPPDGQSLADLRYEVSMVRLNVPK